MVKEKSVNLVNQLKAATDTDEAWKIGRTLMSRGLDPASNSLMDQAIIQDNRKAVDGYIQRATGKGIHYARKSGKRDGIIKANELEAERLKELGLSTTDPKRLMFLISEIDAGKRAIDKLKNPRNQSTHVWNKEWEEGEEYAAENGTDDARDDNYETGGYITIHLDGVNMILEAVIPKQGNLIPAD